MILEGRSYREESHKTDVSQTLQSQGQRQGLRHERRCKTGRHRLVSPEPLFSECPAWKGGIMRPGSSAGGQEGAAACARALLPLTLADRRRDMVNVWLLRQQQHRQGM